MEGFTTGDMVSLYSILYLQMVIKKVIDEGRAAVIAANKWDLVEDKYKKKAVKWMDK